MPPSNLVTIPEHVSFSQAALAEPIACGWHTVRMGLGMVQNPAESLSCLVLGGGAIGLGSALSLRAQGVQDVTLVEPNDKRRLFLSEKCGQSVVADAQTLDPASFDFVIDGVGYAATRAAASALVKAGGLIGHIGLGQASDGLDIRRMTLQEITFFGTYTYTAEDFRQTAAAIFDGSLGALDWIAERPLDQGQKAFEDILKGTVANPKIILKP
jgi:threonine dehydrogenase-like Zn-dependent dehydrogenase